ncbi:tyrosine recombinase xerC-like [Peptoclostridium acidaminophilum DSM 3953]|uniref:Tyrosine recombinase xerC-like n=1 Tax=Peptoclostridium acidaminophilum DSM 3953 TaxID=1286171 RepID=W8T3L7_PEPAC|nr:tyrosine-type recombinase/integrase [Peptoclostridium acidaminophilum]AHM56364.1 tyrosine recombinase xerC-like [Peptoclostridium acidaminophilum DSM 3953]
MRGHVRKRGKKWAIVLDVGTDPQTGKRKQRWFSGYATKRDAEKELAEKINEIENGTFVMPKNISMAEYLEYWLEKYASNRLSPTTLYGYRMIIEKHIVPAIGDIRLQKLRPLDIQTYYDEKGESLSGKTLTQHHRVLRKALDYAFRMQLIIKNPADVVSPPKIIKYKARALTLDEVRLLIEKLKESEYLNVPINVVLSLGLRRGELLALKWEDIDFNKGIITIQRNLVRAGTKLVFKDPKSETSNRKLKLSPTLLSMLKEHRRKQLEHKIAFESLYCANDFLFCKENGEPINPAGFSHRFGDFLRRHDDLPNVRLHDLRHTNATLMLQQNISPKIASSRLGHSNISITLDLYSHVLFDMEEKTANLMDDILYKAK